jgi:hypothetical protein
MSRSPGRKCTGASTCVYAWQLDVKTVDWKMAPDSCVERRSLATFQRKCGLSAKERSTVRMSGMVCC